MATSVDQLIVEIRAETAGLRKGLDRVNKQLDVTNKRAKASVLSFSNLGRVFAVLGLARLGSGIINTARTFEDLEALPGVGHKTASVIMSQAFSQPAFPVDTHIHRLAFRWNLSNGKNVIQTEKDLKRKFSQKIWGKLHLQMIYYGREFCQAKKNKCMCVICIKTSK